MDSVCSYPLHPFHLFAETAYSSWIRGEGQKTSGQFMVKTCGDLFTVFISPRKGSYITREPFLTPFGTVVMLIRHGAWDVSYAVSGSPATNGCLQ